MSLIRLKQNPQEMHIASLTNHVILLLQLSFSLFPCSPCSKSTEGHQDDPAYHTNWSRGARDMVEMELWGLRSVGSEVTAFFLSPV